MKKNSRFIIVLISIFVVILSTTFFASFSSNIEVQEVVVKSITPVYDSTSTIEVNNTNVVFNDKNQVVDYKVVIENTQDYDVKIIDIQLSTPTEEFLIYEIKNINKNDIVEANSTKELIISLETTGEKGWGRNFNDELTANISFERVRKAEQVEPPKEDNKEEVETPKEEVKQPEPPAPTIKEVIKQTEKIEPTKVTKDVIEFKEEVKVNVGDKIAVWIYSEPIFLGYFDVVEANGVKQIVGLEEALKKADIEVGEHNIVLSTEKGETLGYVEVYVSENNQLSEESPEEGKIENPYTNTGWLIVYVTVAGIAVIGIVILRNKKVNKYFILFISLSSVLSLVKAEDSIDLSITLNASFKSQNVMKPSGIEWSSYEGGFISDAHGVDYWAYSMQIKNFYIQNEITEIADYQYRFDVTEEENGRVVAYLVGRENEFSCQDFEANFVQCYDLYLQADGIIYPNEDASYYFAGMGYLESINNLIFLDTSEVTSMRGMFNGTGEFNNAFTLDVSSFDTKNVIDMSGMFEYTGYISPDFTLDITNFDTSNVTDMSSMFLDTGCDSEIFTLDVSNFDTSNVTDMSSMFQNIGANSESFTLDVTNFDTSNVTDMSSMFYYTGANSESFTLDVSNFDTSKVTDMSGMFSYLGYDNEIFNLDVSGFDTSKVTDMSYMFEGSGHNSTDCVLDVNNFNFSNVVDMNGMFYGACSNDASLKIGFTIKNPNVRVWHVFFNTALLDGAEIIVNYTSETKGIANRMVNSKSEGANVFLGEMVEVIEDDNELTIGEEVEINGEYFNVVSQTEDMVTLLPQYNLGTDYRQSHIENGVKFSNTNGWEYTPGPKEIDIWEWSTNPQTYVNEYVEYLKEELNDDFVTGNLITLKDLEKLGCTVPSDYARHNVVWTCESSLYGWLANGQQWWTRSALSENDNDIWYIYRGGSLQVNYFNYSGIRPVITISKEALNKYLKA